MGFRQSLGLDPLSGPYIHDVAFFLTSQKFEGGEGGGGCIYGS